MDLAISMICALKKKFDVSLLKIKIVSRKFMSEMARKIFDGEFTLALRIVFFY